MTDSKAKPAFDATSAVAELPEMFAAIRGEQRESAARVAIDELAELVDRAIPGFAESARLAWLRAEEIAEPADMICTVCGVEMTSFNVPHDVDKHRAARAAERAGVTTLVEPDPDGPVLDADGEPVEIPECFSGNIDDVRTFFAGRVKMPCGHYGAKSERDAGFKTCERC